MANAARTVAISCVVVLGAITAQPVSAAGEIEDSDADSLPDDWERQHFGNLRDQSHSDDPDGDGVSNLAEMQVGTNPNDPADH
ncbi:thrombospondin type 3 repeat-containing protein [Luteolibacter sp. GHJ8]|uniref:Thrombospondin type 3 repeat-containing protein n=1 Tax=Luteolibacter rhizosphaerae TaxID=2989719 RepID=A0ABT3G4I9_9BACT|nr:thrombospondin type 3 repeat-containing protein [Luteolibacter rhizosphaerae]MCW1914756.1 thrombospondin type 3 repeat-containing protein [Luteolibacter rhizosphaerae]